MTNDRYFKKEKKSHKKTIKGLLIGLLIAIVLFLFWYLPQNMSMDVITRIRIISRYFATAIVAIGVTTIFYSFTGIFKCKTGLRCLITAVMLSACIFWYIESRRPPDVIRMKEDQLYILPKSSTNEKI